MSAQSQRLRSCVVVLVCVAALAAAISCGSSSLPSSPGSLGLRPGRHVVTLGGFSLSSDPRYPPCTPLGVLRDGPSVDTLVNLAREGQEWVARSVGGMGDLVDQASRGWADRWRHHDPRVGAGSRARGEHPQRSA